MIQRAGDYHLEVTLNGDHITNSPYVNYRVRPNVLSAPQCVAVGIPEIMHAGFEYNFLIQGRDQFSNNVDNLLRSTNQDVSVNFENTADGSISVAGTITDDANAHGVYRVTVELLEQLQIDLYTVEVYFGRL